VYESSIKEMRTGVTKSFLKAWGIFTALWIVAATTQIYHYYTPLFNQHNFIYNPMVNANGLIDDNPENREKLKRTFLQGWNNIYSFGEPGKVVITFSEEYFRDGYLETWMPNGSSLASVSIRSPVWMEFRQKLIAEGMKLREDEADEIYRAHLSEDILLLFGIPLAFLVGFISSRSLKHFLADL
jgi:hypothetical protein